MRIWTIQLSGLLRAEATHQTRQGTGCMLVCAGESQRHGAPWRGTKGQAHFLCDLCSVEHKTTTDLPKHFSQDMYVPASVCSISDYCRCGGGGWGLISVAEDHALKFLLNPIYFLPFKVPSGGFWDGSYDKVPAIHAQDLSLVSSMPIKTRGGRAPL